MAYNGAMPVRKCLRPILRTKFSVGQQLEGIVTSASLTRCGAAAVVVQQLKQKKRQCAYLAPLSYSTAMVPTGDDDQFNAG